MKTTVNSLQRDIAFLEKYMLNNKRTVNNERLNKKKEELGYFFTRKRKRSGYKVKNLLDQR